MLGAAGPDVGCSGDGLALQDPDRAGPESVVNPEPSIRAGQTVPTVWMWVWRAWWAVAHTLPVRAAE